jgi:hypothetical protein
LFLLCVEASFCETARRAQPLSSWADQPEPSGEALFASGRVSIVHAHPAVVQSGERISIKALGGGSRAPRRQMLGTRLVWKQNRGQAGFHLINPIEVEGSRGRDGSASASASPSAPSRSCFCSCTSNLKIGLLQERSWPYRQELSRVVFSS